MPMISAAQRLFVDADLAAGATHRGRRASQANYLLQRAAAEGGRHDPPLQRARRRMAGAHRRRAAERLRARGRGADARADAPPDLHYLFAPLKHARLDYMVQKAVEMGAGRLRPVLTAVHAGARASISSACGRTPIEAAEQCGILSIPEIDAPRKLADVLADWDPARRLVFCDEARRRPSPADGARRPAARPGGAAHRPGRRLLRARARRPSRAAPTSRRCRSGRASCAPTRRRWRRWRWCSPSSAIGDKRLCRRARAATMVRRFSPERRMARDTADLTPIESRDQLAAHLESGCKPREEWRIGTEHEKFGFYKDGHSPVPYEGRKRHPRAARRHAGAARLGADLRRREHHRARRSDRRRRRSRSSRAGSSSFPARR